MTEKRALRRLDFCGGTGFGALKTRESFDDKDKEAREALGDK